jgi:hypothetical protein
MSVTATARRLYIALHSIYTGRMRGTCAFVLAVVIGVPAFSQTGGRKAAAPPPASLKKVAPGLTCPTVLGVGLKTKASFCEVMAGRDPAGGVLVQIPPHRGPATLTFDLHNLHLYSEEQVRTHRAYARYTATVGVLTMDNTLVSRAIVQSEFRTAADLVERVGGGAGPGGAKAVAPTGTESVTIVIPEAENQVSVLGEKLTVERVDGSATYTQPGRPIAVLSNVMLEYRPGPLKPAPKAAAKPPAKKLR